MANRILDQRLNEERRNGGEAYFGRNLHLDFQLIAEADLLNGEIVIEKRELLRQWNFLFVF